MGQVFATVNISAASTGTTIITASGESGTPAASIAVVFITATASTVTAQASPSTVGVNPVGSQANQSVLSVVVRDVSNNLVKNAHVTFNQAVDVTGGPPCNGCCNDGYYRNRFSKLCRRVNIQRTKWGED